MKSEANPDVIFSFFFCCFFFSPWRQNNLRRAPLSPSWTRRFHWWPCRRTEEIRASVKGRCLLWQTVVYGSRYEWDQLTCCCAVWCERWGEGPWKPFPFLSVTSAWSWDRPTSPWTRHRTTVAVISLHNKLILKKKKKSHFWAVMTTLRLGSLS